MGNEQSNMRKPDILSKLREAIDNTISDEPYMSEFIYGFTVALSDVETAAVNIRYEILVDPNYIEKSSVSELEFALLHEQLHILFNHPARMVEYVNIKENKELASYAYNLASDMIVNRLVEEGLIIPRVGPRGIVRAMDISKITGIAEDELYNMTEEQIADKIYEKLKVGYKVKTPFVYGNEYKWIDKSGEPIHDGIWSGKDKKYIEDTLKSKIEGLKSAGVLPEALVRRLDNIYFKDIRWFILLSSYLHADIVAMKVRSTYRRYSRKYEMLPSYEFKEIPQIVFLVDTSGSMSKSDLEDGLSIIFSILSKYKVKVSIYCWDGDVYEELTAYSSGDIINIAKSRIRGGGGTYPNPAFKKILQLHKRNAILIIYTDGIWSKDKNTGKLFDEVVSKYNRTYLVTTDKIPSITPDRVIVIKKN